MQNSIFVSTTAIEVVQKIQFSSALLRSRSFKKFNFRQHYRVRDCLKIQEFRNSMLTVVLVVGVVVDVVGVVVDVVGV